MALRVPFPPAARRRPRNDLPKQLPGNAADALALRVHSALDALRRCRAGREQAQTVTEALVVVAFACDNGHSLFDAATLRDADRALAACFDEGNAGGEWFVEETPALERMVCAYDRLVHRAPVALLTQAAAKLDRIRASETRHPKAA